MTEWHMVEYKCMSHEQWSWQKLLAKQPMPHFTENPIYVFPEMKLRFLVPKSYIHVSVSDLYIPRIGLPIWLQQNRKTDPENI
jgi:hypothetical protein